LRLHGTWTDGQTDGQTDGRTDRVIPIYPSQRLFAGDIINRVPFSLECLFLHIVGEITQWLGTIIARNDPNSLILVPRRVTTKFQPVPFKLLYSNPLGTEMSKNAHMY
jgi:hypothetical protein